MSFFEKLKSGLTDFFNLTSEFPESPVIAEMEKDGWRFDVHYVIYPYGAAAIHTIRTPDDRTIDMYHRSEPRKIYDDAVARTRTKLGLAPK